MKTIKLILILLIIGFNLIELNAQNSIRDSLENQLKKHKTEDTIRINLLTAIAYEQDDIDTLFIYATEAEKLSKKLKYSKGEAISYHLIGAYYQFTDNLPKAIEFYKKSTKLNEKINNSEALSNSMLSLAIVYLYQSNYYVSLEFHHKVLKIAFKNKNNSKISACYNNIGMIYQELSENNKAIEFYKKSIKIDKVLADSFNIANTYSNIGTIYFEQANYKQAYAYYQRAMKIHEKFDNKYALAIGLGNIGTVYYKLGKYTDALDYLEKALKYGFEKVDCKTFYYMGAVKQEQKKYSKALEHTIKSFKIAKKHKLLLEQKDANEQLAKIYTQTSDYKMAYESYFLFKVLNDSIFNKKNIQKITGLQYQYEFDKEKLAIEAEQKKKDALQVEKSKLQKYIRNSFITAFVVMVLVALLILRGFIQKRKANSILAEQKMKILQQAENLKLINQKLEELDQLKQGMTGMLVHDLKNPISTILSLSQNKEISSASKQMLNMVSNILDVQKYEKTEMQIDTKPASLYKLSFHAIADVRLLAEQKKVEIKNNITTNTFIETDSEISNRIFINLLTNAIKYSPENGTVTINCEKDIKNNNFIKISITDNGIGIEKNKLNTVFNKFAQIMAKKSGQAFSTGLGLTFCKMAIEAHKGTISIYSVPNIETTFSFTLPLADNSYFDEVIPIISIESEKIQLNEQEKEYLMQFIEEYRKYEIYDIIPIRKISESIDENFSDNVKKWKNKIQKIIYNTNETEYNSLIL